MTGHMSSLSVQEQLARADVFCNIGRALTSSLNPKDVFERVMTIIGDYFSPRNWSLLFLDDDHNRLTFQIVMGVDAEKLKDVFLERGEGIVGWVCEKGVPVLVEDAQNDDRFSSRLDQILSFKTESVVCVPLINGQDRVIGAIELVNKIVPPSVKSAEGLNAVEVIPTPVTFTEIDMCTLAAIGAFTGIAAENAFLHQRVKDMAMLDSLTGIFNRHYFNEIFYREVERAKRYRHSTCLLMLDLDRFKQINDQFGHLVGDQVLVALGTLLRRSIRESDTLARFGGDEFIILMPEAGEFEGEELAARIQTRIDTWNQKNEIPGLQIGVSIGVKASGPQNLENILKLADEDLLHKKGLRRAQADLTSGKQICRYLRRMLESGDSSDRDGTDGL